MSNYQHLIIFQIPFKPRMTRKEKTLKHQPHERQQKNKRKVNMHVHLSSTLDITILPYSVI